jgi:hypothetical protein
MSLADIRVLTLLNRNRVAVRIGERFAELTGEEAQALMTQLHRAALQVSFSSCDPALRGDGYAECAGPDPVASARLTERIFAQLHRAAVINAPCPSNRHLAERLNLAPDMPLRLIKRLEQLGRIKVERYAKTRVVTIIETGERTAMPPPSAVYQREPSRQMAVA